MPAHNQRPEQAKWRVWDQLDSYGETLYKRAVGELPEMESSKKIAREVSAVFRTGDQILDVGCGAGHYLRSLRREIGNTFTYVGVDATSSYIERARAAFAHDQRGEFLVSDIFQLDLPDRAFDIVLCNNLFLHLPSICKPLSELVRVARRTLFVRLLCGDRSFRIQDVRQQEDGREFNDAGEPADFYYYNIYSRAYLKHLVSQHDRVQSWCVSDDNDFDRQAIIDSQQDHGDADNATAILGNRQVNGYIVQPWSILRAAIAA